MDAQLTRTMCSTLTLDDVGEDFSFCEKTVFSNNIFTWMTSPVPSKPASVKGVDVTVAVWMFALAAALSRRILCLGATRRTSGLLARKETRPMKHAM